MRRARMPTHKDFMHNHTNTNAQPARRRLSLSFPTTQPKQPASATLSPSELRRIVAEMVG